MFTALHFENYKSFRKLDLNLQSGTKPKNLVAIYGENGSGKTNIVSAFTNLRQSIDTVNGQEMLAQLQKEMFDTKPEGKANLEKDFFRKIINEQTVSPTLRDIFLDTQTIDSQADMKIRYDFKINEKNGYYELIFKKGDDGLYLASEALHYLIKKATGEIYHITGDEAGKITVKWSPSLFSKKSVGDLVFDNVQRLWGKHTFLAIFNNIRVNNNRKYLQDNVASGFLAVLKNFRRLAYRVDNRSGQVNFAKLLRNFSHGELTENDANLRRLTVTESVINKYFVPLYSDMMQLFFRKTGHEDGKLSYELFEKKRVGGKLIEIPFRMESHGTKRLLELLPLLLNAVHGETVVIDEIDQGVHDLLIDRLIDNVRDDLQGQLIFTTHDTQVMKQLDLANVYVIQSDATGNKRVISLANSGQSVAVHNNVQKLYLEGYFSGIPYADNVDFFDILQDLEVK
ncbi:AAA family ATPase [Levilactobacillus brevis]|uniref:AAA family ATPase n=1 Tax=Levilactobacillus brevis TaxID=1580 RepID=UPI00084823F0|nr:AAA family ATPase [Levilactobacillus brevis]ODP93831.1 hypothetical protein BGC39_05350 [Levilactobacillus brevis]HJD98469.1 AAA family ATPase [Levilactobacillus brevis]